MPYNPNIQYVGGQLLAQGLSQFGSGIGSGIQARQERLDSLKKQNAASKGLRQAFVNLGLMERDEAENLSFEALTAFGTQAPSLLQQPLRQQQLKSSQSSEARAENADARAEKADARAEELAPLNKELLETRLMQGQTQNELLNAELESMNQRSQAMGVALPEGLEMEGATVAKDGSVSYNYKAKGTKELSQSEVLQLAAISQAERDLDELEKFFSSKRPDFGGPMEARVKNFGAFFFGPDPDVKQADDLATAAVPNLARGVFRETGVLTDADREAYAKLLPAAKDTPETRKRKFSDLRQRLRTQISETKNMLKAAGRDTSGLDEQEEASAPGASSIDRLKVRLRRGASGGLEQQ